MNDLERQEYENKRRFFALMLALMLYFRERRTKHSFYLKEFERVFEIYLKLLEHRGIDTSNFNCFWSRATGYCQTFRDAVINAAVHGYIYSKVTEQNLYYFEPGFSLMVRNEIGSLLTPSEIAAIDEVAPYVFDAYVGEYTLERLCDKHPDLVNKLEPIKVAT